MTKIKLTNLWIFFIISTLGFLTYFNSLQGEFLSDDNNYVLYNQSLNSFKNLPFVFTHTIAAASSGNYIYYRPLQELSYLIDYQFWQLNPFGYHLTNIFLHIFVSILIFIFLNQLNLNKFLSAVAAMLFVVHPLHTEATSCISGRGEALATIFLLLTLIFYLKQNFNWFNLFIFYLLALLAKEGSIILLGIVFLYHYCFRKPINFKKIIPLLTSVVVYFVIRIFLVSSTYSLLSNLKGSQERLPGFFVALLSYIRLLIFPTDLHFDYGQPIFHWHQPVVLLGILLFVYLIYLAIRLRTTNPIATFALSWFLIALLPYSNIVLLFNFMAEHFIYFSSIGYFLIIAILFNEIYRKYRLLALGLLAVLIVLLSFISILQNQYWLNAKEFYTRTIFYNPLSYNSYLNLGVLYGREGNLRREIEFYEKALNINTNNANIYLNLGLALTKTTNLQLAKEYLLKAKSINPNLAAVYNGLGVISAQEEKREEAKEFFQTAIKKNNRYLDAYINLANIFLQENDKKKVVEIYAILMKINPIKFRKSYLELLENGK